MKDMTKSDCDGMEKAQNKYVSFSYIVDRSWVPPARCTMHILERKNLGSVPSSDDVLEDLQITELINYVYDYQRRGTISVLNSIHAASRLILEYMESTVKAYSYGIRCNVIERVRFFYLWVRCFQSDSALEITFFALVEYRNGKRVFKILKLLPDDLSSDSTIFDYINQSWNIPIPTIHVDTKIYRYCPDGEEKMISDDSNEVVIGYNSIFGLFIFTNFGLHLLPDENAQIAIIGMGRLAVSDDTRNRRVLRILREKSIYVSVENTIFDNYFSRCRKAFLALTYMETYRDVLISYRNLCRKRHLTTSQAAQKDAFEHYIIEFSKKGKVRLDCELEELVRKKNSSAIKDIIATAFAKTVSEVISL